MAFYSLVHHISFRRRTEHLIYCQIKWADTISLFKSETGITGSFTYSIHWGTFAVGYLLYVFNSRFINQQPHTFLRLIGNNLFGRQCFVTDRQFVHVD